MLNPPQLATRHKIMIFASAGLILVGGSAFFAVRYFQTMPGVGPSQTGNLATPAKADYIDLAQLSAVYQAESAKILSEFLAGADGNSPAIGISAKQAQEKMLALSLPAQYRQKHLAEVLILGEIAVLSEQGATAELNSKISELKQLATD